MMLVRMRKHDDFDTEVLDKGHHYVRAELNELVFFVRKDKAIKFCEPSKKKNSQHEDSDTRIAFGLPPDKNLFRQNDRR